MNELLRRAWDTLDSFKQVYPENWQEDDQQVLDDLIKADADLSGIKRKWVGLTDEEMYQLANQVGFDAELMQRNHDKGFPSIAELFAKAIDAKLKEKNT